MNKGPFIKKIFKKNNSKKKIHQGFQQRFETTDYSEKSLTMCVYSFSCHYFGGENVHIVQVFIQGFWFIINIHWYVGFDYLLYM